MNRETLDRWCERGILGLVLAILVLGPLATGAVRPLEFLIIQGLTLGVLVLWGARLWLSPRPQLLWPPICWAVAAFTILAIGRYLTADIEYVARQELIHILVYAFLFFAVLNNLYRQESMLGNHVHAGIPGDGDFLLRGLSILHPLSVGVEHPGAS